MASWIPTRPLWHSMTSVLGVSIAVMLSMSIAAPSYAQDDDGNRSEDEAEEGESPNDADGSEAEAGFHDVMLVLAAGNRSEAEARLAQWIAEHPDHPRAPRAREILATLQADAAGPGDTAPGDVTDGDANLGEPVTEGQEGVAPPPSLEAAERLASPDGTPPGGFTAAPTTSRQPSMAMAARESNPEPRTFYPRFELALVQGGHGLALGFELCLAFDCDSARALTLLPLTGAAAGISMALLFTRDGIRSGQSLAISSGTVWGMFNALTWAGVFNYWEDSLYSYDHDNTPLMWALIGGQLAGTALGALTAYYIQPRVGQVAIANAAGMWASVATTFFLGAADNVDIGARGSMLTLMLAGNGGLALGALLARHVPMTRARALLIHGGAAGGALLGTSLAFAIGGGNVSGTALFATSGVGVVAGWGLAYFLTRNMQLPETTVNASIMPMPGGMGASFQVAL